MPGNRVIVTVAVGNRPDLGKSGEQTIVGIPFTAMLPRWRENFDRHSGGASTLVFQALPPGCPPHLEVPYAFKAYAIREAINRGFTTILWADVAVVAICSLEPIWTRTENLGYWFSDNGNWNCGQWTCDAALPLLGLTRQEAFDIPHVTATAFALDFTKPAAVKFFDDYWEKSNNGAFAGPWKNDNREVSPDPRVLGHRHDQTAASVAVWRLGMSTTKQPAFFTDYRGVDYNTILKVERTL